MTELVLDERYRVIRQLGSGGVGQVFLVEHLALRRLEALKVLRRDVAQSEEAEMRFRREARATNRLQHPNIVSVYDFGRLGDGRYYLTTEFVDGPPLDAMVSSLGPLPMGRALNLVEQLASAIVHAHSRGVLHRDLKPSNIIISEYRGHRDRLKVLDFGLAKIIAPDYSEAVGISDANFVLGTPGYIAPEVLRGKPSDERADVYAIGCVAIALVTGRPAYRGAAIEIAQRQLMAPPPRPSDRLPKLPTEIDDLVQRCMATKPDDRFSSAEAVIGAIHAVPGYQRDSDSGRRIGYRRWLAGSRRAGTREDTFDEEKDSTVRERELLSPGEFDALSSGSFETVVRDEESQRATDSYREAQNGVAEALLDAGCNSEDLVLALADVRRHEDEIHRIAGVLADFDARCEAMDQRTREREPPLRFALAELRQRREAVASPSDPSISAIDRRIAGLEERLASLSEEHARTLNALTDEAVLSAAQLDDAEDQAVSLYQELDVQIAVHAAAFEKVAAVREAQDRALRGHRAIHE